MHKRTMKILMLALWAASLVSCGVDVPIANSSSETPKVVQPENISGSRSIGITSLAFFEGKLYAGSSIGLLEFDGRDLTQVHKWSASDDVVEQVVVDEANDLLWLFHAGRGVFFRYDGEKWSSTQLPKLEEGEEYSRRDLAGGLKPIASENGLWLQTLRGVWKWNPHTNDWTAQELPQENCVAPSGADFQTNDAIRCFAGIAPIDKGMIVFRHRVYFGDTLARADFGKDLPSDSVVYFEAGQWRQIQHQLTNFVVSDKHIAVGREAVFVKTIDDRLFRVTPSGVTPLESLGSIEALTTTSTGTLLACFQNRGVFELENDWRERFALPVSGFQNKNFTFLAESSGKIAFAVSPATRGGTTSRDAAVWIYEEGRLAPLTLSE